MSKSEKKKMKKKINEVYVQICPLCGSTDVGVNFENSAGWAYGNSASYQCNSCGNIANIFPEVLKKDVSIQSKKIQKKSKELKLKPNIDSTIKFKVKPDETESDYTHLIIGLIFVIISFFMGLYWGMIFIGILYIIRYLKKKILKKNLN